MRRTRGSGSGPRSVEGAGLELLGAGRVGQRGDERGDLGHAEAPGDEVGGRRGRGTARRPLGVGVEPGRRATATRPVRRSRARGRRRPSSRRSTARRSSRPRRRRASTAAFTGWVSSVGVGRGQHDAAGADDPGRLGQRHLGVGDVVERERRDDRGARARRERQPPRVGHDRRRPRAPGRRGACPSARSSAIGRPPARAMARLAAPVPGADVGDALAGRAGWVTRRRARRPGARRRARVRPARRRRWPSRRRRRSQAARPLPGAVAPPAELVVVAQRLLPAELHEGAEQAQLHLRLPPAGRVDAAALERAAQRVDRLPPSTPGGGPG